MKTKSNINKKPLCHCVTSPLNKGSNIRPMKDSGIQWIGQIPEKERLEIREKRIVLVKQVRARTVIARLRRSRGNPVKKDMDVEIGN